MSEIGISPAPIEKNEDEAELIFYKHFQKSLQSWSAPSSTTAASKELITRLVQAKLLSLAEGVFHAPPREPLESTLTQRSSATKPTGDELKEEHDRLLAANRLLESRVAEERRTSARETQRYDQLVKELHKVQSQNDTLLDILRGRTQAADTTTALLLHREQARLLMMEKYDGVVVHTSLETAIVAFEVDDDVVEHTYQQDQFVDKQVPPIGKHISVYVHVVERSIDANEMVAELAEWDELEGHEAKTLHGPIEF